MILHEYVVELKRAGLVPRIVSSPAARDVLMRLLLASGERNLAGSLMQVARLLGHKTEEMFRTLLNRFGNGPSRDHACVHTSKNTLSHVTRLFRLT